MSPKPLGVEDLTRATINGTLSVSALFWIELNGVPCATVHRKVFSHPDLRKEILTVGSVLILQKVFLLLHSTL